MFLKKLARLTRPLCLKDTLEIIIDTLADIVNCSFMTSTYPMRRKLAEIIPSHKDSDRDNPSNNRPV